MTPVVANEGRTRASALEGLVESGPLPYKNPLADNRSYDQVGSNSFLEVVPGIVHFGGFQVNMPSVKVIQIRNVAGISTRVHVLPPETPYFQMRWRCHKGSIAPGMCEELEIKFYPKEWKYYYDCIRIHSEDENIVIPMHGYPKMSKSSFPTEVNFGKCPVGSSTTRTVVLKCDVPVDFQFVVDILKPNANFKLSALEGTVPAEGETMVEISFRPDSYTTQDMIIVVQIDEFNSEPIYCHIQGSGFPGEHLTNSLNAENFVFQNISSYSMCTEKSAQPILHETQRQRSKRRSTVEPIDATSLRNLCTHSGLAHILNESANCLGDRAALDGRKQGSEQLNEVLQDVLKHGEIQNVEPLCDHQLSQTAKALMFQKRLNDFRKQRSLMEMTSCVSVGNAMMSAEEISNTVASIDSMKVSQNMVKEQDAVERHQPEKYAGSAINSHRCLDSETSTSNPGTLGPPVRNDWAKRTWAFQKFQNAARTVIVRIRAQKRLQLIKQVAERLCFDKAAIAAEAEIPRVTKPRDSCNNTFDLSNLIILPVDYDPPWVKMESSKLPEFAPLTLGIYEEYSELREYDLKVPLEYKLLGYKPEESPKIDCYMPLLKDQPLMGGAEEEYMDPVPIGIVACESELDPMPEAMKAFPYVNYEIGSRYEDNKIFTTPPPSWGYDPRYPVQPKVLEFINTGKQEDRALNSVRAFEHQPLLSDTWKPTSKIPTLVVSDHIPQMMNGPAPSDDIGMSTPVPLEQMQKIKGIVNDTCGSDNKDAPKKLEHPRSRRLQELDNQKRAQRKATMDQYQESIKEFNKLVNKPYKYALH